MFVLIKSLDIELLWIISNICNKKTTDIITTLINLYQNLYQNNFTITKKGKKFFKNDAENYFIIIIDNENHIKILK